MFRYKNMLLTLFVVALTIGCGSTGSPDSIDLAVDSDAGAQVNFEELVNEKCKNDGEVLEVNDSLVVVCHGVDGENGGSMTLSVEEADTNDCPNGGNVVSVVADDGSVHTAVICNGSDGANGEDGTNGENGSDGQDGSDGSDGQNGQDGLDGEDGQNGSDGEDGADVDVSLFDANEDECPNGGVRVVVETDNSVDVIPVCNGVDGSDGVDAEVNVVSATTDECPNGGYAVVINNERLLLCNGSDGSTGARGSRGFVGSDGESVLLTPIPEGVEECNGLGGVQLSVGEETELVCNGVPGDSVIVEVSEASEEQCPAGGYVFSLGVETYVGYQTEVVGVSDAGVDGGTLEEQLPLTETVMQESVVMCNGVDGNSVSVSTHPVWWSSTCPGFDSLDGTVITLSEIDGLTEEEVESEEVVICNGEDGENGDTPYVSVMPASQEECSQGGVVIQVNDSSETVCNGEQGPQGEDGEDGISCTAEKVDGGTELTCSNGTVIIEDGEDGTPCELDEETRVLTCGDEHVILPEEVVNDCPGEWFHTGITYHCFDW